MKKNNKLALAGGILLLTTVAASSCTTNMCTNLEKARILFALEPGVSEYFNSETEAQANVDKLDTENYEYEITSVAGTSLYRRVVKDKTNGNYYKYDARENKERWTTFSKLTDVFTSARSKSIQIPDKEYFVAIDDWILTTAASKKGLEVSALTVETAQSALVEFGYEKFGGNPHENKNGEVDITWQTMFANMDAKYAELQVTLGLEKCPNRDFMSLYQSTLNTAVANTKSCIALQSGDYGAYGQEGTSITIDKKSWGYAWSKGPISGLIVWPVAALTEVLARAFAGNNVDVMMAGWPQLLALLIVTIIVRLIIFGVTFKSTLTQQKMQALQPELAKIQAKYPNSNTSQSEKQRLAEEQMKLYKKHKVNPLSSLLTIVIQFPFFIGVWGAMTGSAALSTGKFLNLNLSASILDTLKNFDGMPTNINGWWTALVLFILMSVSQFLAMKIPQWIQKAKTKKVARLGVNPAQNQQNKTMNMVSWVMLIMIIFMGFTLPAAMGVYWFVGALISLALSLITQNMVNKNKK